MKKEQNTREFNDALNEYTGLLSEKLSDLSKQLRKEFDLLKENIAKDVFTINGANLTINQFTIIFGTHYLKRPVSFGGRWLLYEREDQKEIIKRNEEYLKSITGMVMPKVPEILKDWLESN